MQRRSDALLRSLGITVLAQRTGRGNPQTSAEIDRLISEITEHERLNNIDIVQQASAWATGQGRRQMGPGPMAPGPGPMGPGPGPNFPSPPPPANQTVGGSMPGAGAGYAGYGAPGAAGVGGPPGPGPQAQPFPSPPSFPPPPSFPSEQAFPQGAGPTRFPSASPTEPVTQPAPQQPAAVQDAAQQPAPVQDAPQQERPQQERPESSA